MSRYCRVLCVVALVIPVVVFGQAPAASPDSEKLGQIFAAYQHLDTPGCAVSAEVAGQTPWSAAFGMADLEHNVSNTPETVFEAGSVSKQFTAAAVLLLVERGQVSLDDDIRKYFAEMPKYPRPITVRELLNHTSGLRDWGSIEDIAGWPRTTREYTHAHVLEILSRQKSLNYGPGDAWSYTNSGYNLAAMLVERVSGMSLQAFEKKEFFEPLEMHSTQWRDDFRRVVLNRAIAYDSGEQGWRQDMPFEDTYGHGGLLTTVSDLQKWNANITSGKLHGTIFALMQKPSALRDGQAVQYGFGLGLGEFQGMAEVSHSGATAGYRTWLGRIPEKGISVAVLCNASSANTTRLAHDVIDLYLGLPEPKVSGTETGVSPGLYRNAREGSTMKVAEKDGVVTVDGRPARAGMHFADGKITIANSTYGEDVWQRVEAWTPKDLSEFAGTYVSDEAETILRVVVEDGKLVIHRRPASAFVLTQTYGDAFECDMGNVRFARDAKGKVIALSLGQSRVWNLQFVRGTATAH